MSGAVKIAFGSLSAPKGSALVVFVGADMKPAPAVTAQFGDLEPLIRTAAKASNFRGAQRTALDILAPAGLDASRLVVVGVAPGKDNAPLDFVMLGGFVFGKVTGAQAGRSRVRGPVGDVGRRRGRGFRARSAPSRLPVRQVQDAQEGDRGRERRSARVRHRLGSRRRGARGLARSICRRRRRRTWRAISSMSRRTSSFPSNSPIAPRRWRSSGSR